MNYTVYVLRSENTGRHYIGCTINLEKRLHEHNNGKNTSTRNKGPWKVIYHEENFTKKSDALRRERKIKSMKGGIQFKKILTDLQHINGGCSSVG
ncbi:MAG: GIY-YIG nuclease family protein [Patescibacteria group bacterium]